MALVREDNQNALGGGVATDSLSLSTGMQMAVHADPDHLKDTQITRSDVRLEPLTPLNLRECGSLGDLMRGYSRCSFGARMLGEVAETLCSLAERGTPPTAIYEGLPGSQMDILLREMAKEGIFDRVQTPSQYLESGENPCIVVVGRFSEMAEPAVFEKPDRAIFINENSMTKPGQVKDGYFPDAVFCDPRFILPLLRGVVNERLGREPISITDFVEHLSPSEGLGSLVREGAKVLEAMVNDKECTVFLTLSGAMTVAQMSLVICDMIDYGMVQSVTSTGALMAHGLMPGLGLKHYKQDPKFSDQFLAEHSLNRVTDTLEPESNFTQAANVLDQVLTQYPGTEPLTPSQLHSDMGRYLAEYYPNQRAILRSAHEKNIPIFVPAFVDSELGNDVYAHNMSRVREGRPRLIMDLELDSARLVELAVNSNKMGIFTIGGGVPRNNVQNVAPLMEILSGRVPGCDIAPKMFSYGVRISPDQMHIGHLSGCTYSEGASWRKFNLDASKAELQSDATIVWPMMVKYVMDRIERN